MPYLVEAFVRLGNCDDFCKHSYEIGDCGDESCWGCHFCRNNYVNNNCILLHGLSSCTNLELTAGTSLFIFRKDLTRCPVFSKLKTLLLNEWCITNNLGALICFLQHSPILEKLIIQIESPQIHERLVEIGASYDLRKQPLVLKDLIVEVRCDYGDEHFHKVLDVLGSYGLPPDKIKIQQPPKLTRAQFDDTWTSGSFSFEQESSHTVDGGTETLNTTEFMWTENEDNSSGLVYTGNSGSYHVISTVITPGVGGTATLSHVLFMYIFAILFFPQHWYLWDIV